MQLNQVNICEDLDQTVPHISLQDYGWVKQGIIFPFVDYLDRFQGQPLYKLKPSKFRSAIEEAFLAERGFFELQPDGGAHWRNISMTSLPLMAYRKGLVLIISKSVNLRPRLLVKSSACCDSCGNRLPSKISKKKKQDGGQLLCRHCEKLLQPKQYCGICKKICHHTHGGNWLMDTNGNKEVFVIQLPTHKVFKLFHISLVRELKKLSGEMKCNLEMLLRFLVLFSWHVKWSTYSAVVVDNVY